MRVDRINNGTHRSITDIYIAPTPPPPAPFCNSMWSCGISIVYHSTKLSHACPSTRSLKHHRELDHRVCSPPFLAPRRTARRQHGRCTRATRSLGTAMAASAFDKQQWPSTQHTTNRDPEPNKRYGDCATYTQPCNHHGIVCLPYHDQSSIHLGPVYINQNTTNAVLSTVQKECTALRVSACSACAVQLPTLNASDTHLTQQPGLFWCGRFFFNILFPWSPKGVINPQQAAGRGARSPLKQTNYNPTTLRHLARLSLLPPASSLLVRKGRPAQPIELQRSELIFCPNNTSAHPTAASRWRQPRDTAVRSRGRRRRGRRRGQRQRRRGRVCRGYRRRCPPIDSGKTPTNMVETPFAECDRPGVPREPRVLHASKEKKETPDKAAGVGAGVGDRVGDAWEAEPRTRRDPDAIRAVGVTGTAVQPAV